MRCLLKTVCLLLLWLGAQGAFAQEEEEQNSGEEVVKRLPDNRVKNGWTELKNFSSSERKATCRRFEGKYVAYYGRVYKVENCKRREIEGAERIKQVSQRGVRIQAIDSDTLAKLGAGKSLEDPNAPKRSCQALEGEYVTADYIEFYRIEKCLKRRFPDWATLMQDRKTRRRARSLIVELEAREFYAIKSGKDFKSSIDEEFRKILSGDVEADVIPIDEACAGVNGRYVSYYSRIYKIEKCRKRELDPAKATRVLGGSYEFKELSSSQWLSLPDGAPYEP